MTQQDASPRTPERPQALDTVRSFLSWIAETDRRFRMTQSRIDRFSDRF